MYIVLLPSTPRGKYYNLILLHELSTSIYFLLESSYHVRNYVSYHSYQEMAPRAPTIPKTVFKNPLEMYLVVIPPPKKKKKILRIP